jgi:hypothetical protein
MRLARWEAFEVELMEQGRLRSCEVYGPTMLALVDGEPGEWSALTERHAHHAASAGWQETPVGWRIHRVETSWVLVERP